MPASARTAAITAPPPPRSPGPARFADCFHNDNPFAYPNRTMLRHHQAPSGLDTSRNRPAVATKPQR